MQKIDLGNSSYFIGEELVLGSNFKIGSRCSIKATNCFIGDNVTIGNDNNVLVGEELVIGCNSSIGDNNTITCLKCILGDYLYLDSNIIIGHGGKISYDSFLEIGKHCMICSYVKINVNYSIKIGDDVGIGEYVDIWTHGSFPPILQGFPSQFGSVKVGNNVWLPAKSTVLPNVVIGDNVVIGVNSLINKSLPSGCLAAGIPARIIKENQYPKFDKERNIIMVKEILYEYEKQMNFKNISQKITFNQDEFLIICNHAIFDLNNLSVKGNLGELEEDFRDFMRRRGIKFFTGKPFKSILPDCYKNLLSYGNN
jgi:acetyltransferase-like isoleucine patch superfamily enzyme